MMLFRFPCILFSSVPFLLASCASKATIMHRDPAILLDLATRLAPMQGEHEIAGGRKAESFYRNFPVSRRGRSEDALIIVAPSSVRALISGLSGAVELQALATPVFNLGDGLLMEVLLSDSSDERQVYSRYFDPGRRASDRDWIALNIPLDLGRGRQWSLQVRVSAGLRGDLVGDWLALAAPRLVRGTTR